MKWLAPLATLLASSVASAGTVGGDVVTVQPGSATELVGGGLSAWAAGEVGAGYIGGELSIGSYVTPDDAGISYHALGGIKSRLSDHFLVLADVGAGVTQRFQMHLGLFGGESGADTVSWLPSSAIRVQLVAELGTIGETAIGMSVNSEARAGYDDAELTTGMGLGLGVYLAR